MNFILITVAFTLFQSLVNNFPADIDQNKWYYVYTGDGSYLENPSHRSETRSEAKLITTAKKAGDFAQQWRFIKVEGDGNLYMIVNRKFNSYVDVPYSRKNAGETLFTHRNKGGVNQQFNMVRNPDGSWFIVAKISGHALMTRWNNENHCLYRPEEKNAVKDGGIVSCQKETGAYFVKQMEFAGKNDQKWRLEEVR